MALYEQRDLPPPVRQHFGFFWSYMDSWLHKWIPAPVFWQLPYAALQGIWEMKIGHAVALSVNVCHDG